MVVELDAGGLVVHFQHIIVALHGVTSPQLHMLAFKLDGETHFLTGVTSAHIRGSPSDLALRLGGANALNVGDGLWLDLVALTPGTEFLICESHGVFFPLIVWLLAR